LSQRQTPRDVETRKRPGWWGPDWKGYPVALWVTMLLSALLGYVLVWFALRHNPRMFGPRAPVLGRGLTPGEFLGSIVGGLSSLPGLLVWRKPLRQRGLWSNR
jgi:hypothetical protein